MTGSLQGKRAFVTAAGQGIGRATALAFAAEAALVTATDIDGEKLASLSAHGISTRQLDVLDPHAVEDALRESGSPDLLFNCAGVVHSGSVLDAWDDDFDFAVALNVKAMARTIRAALPAMLERQDGCIINMASVVSSLKGAPNRFVYGVTKAAVIGLTKSVAADFVASGIRCNAICPGTVDSPSLQGRMQAAGDYEAARAAFVARQPMGRLGTPEEIASLAVHLAGAKFTTGQVHVIDGGWSM
ncbi:SDR family oxidoreductase [Tianweitania sediminis]|uniref:SDR family oxidoreductase n=1 Tax=Tianweitania sediminis TaxID=1502156 RepID=A0A8J7QX60_9HYPH|nr:SDR family oxidoreductase [Tianweitania sediminis]MBP0438383.1 SDR family oxidoreductase [Tianweitania sediminis]